MKQYKRIDTSGFFIEDILLDDIPYLTETVEEEVESMYGTPILIDVERAIMRDIIDENGEVIGQEPVISPYYIEKPCTEGFYHPRWNFDTLEWEEGGNPPNEPAEVEIERLKTKLASTDYMIIKCSEYQLIGLELPYDLEGLHIERQALRDRINELEELT